jgi:hypothetical protein
VSRCAFTKFPLPPYNTPVRPEKLNNSRSAFKSRQWPKVICQRDVKDLTGLLLTCLGIGGGKFFATHDEHPLCELVSRVDESVDDARLDGAVAVRRCAQCRKAFRWAAVSCLAEVLSLDAPSAWIRRQR